MQYAGDGHGESLCGGGCHPWTTAGTHIVLYHLQRQSAF